MLKTSYAFDCFSDLDQRSEVERLHRQATVLLAKELATLNELGIQYARDILEIGCGPGFLCGALAKNFPQAQVLGVDSSHQLIEIARTLVPIMPWASPSEIALDRLA